MYAIRSYYAWTALIVGEDELRANEVSLKALRREAQQIRLRRDDIIEGFAAALAKARITSYNVCYTKLLRGQRMNEASLASQLRRRFPGSPEYQKP